MAHKIVLYRRRGRDGIPVGVWLAAHLGDDPRLDAVYPTTFRVVERAGDVAERFARANPGAQIGIRSSEFGPYTMMEYGDVVWMREGFAS
jgi:hypothetical protein